jgi:hypothetical protein
MLTGAFVLIINSMPCCRCRIEFGDFATRTSRRESGEQQASFSGHGSEVLRSVGPRKQLVDLTVRMIAHETKNPGLQGSDIYAARLSLNDSPAAPAWRVCDCLVKPGNEQPLKAGLTSGIPRPGKGPKRKPRLGGCGVFYYEPRGWGITTLQE